MRKIALAVALCLAVPVAVFVLAEDAAVRPRSFAQLEGSPIIESQYGPGINEWAGRYYANRQFEKLAVERVDPAIAFDWNWGSPAEGMPVDRFSVAWTGFHDIPAGVYAVSVSGTMLTTLAVSGETILTKPETSVSKTTTVMHAFEEGNYSIHIRASESSGPASLSVDWTLAGPLPTATPEPVASATP